MMTAMTFLMIHVQTLGKKQEEYPEQNFSCKTNFLNMEFFCLASSTERKNPFVMRSLTSPSFFLRCSYHQQPLKLVLICYLRGVQSSSDVCQKVSRGGSPLMRSHLSFGPADMFIHSLKERKKKNPLRPDFASLITFLHWKSHVQKRTKAFELELTGRALGTL